MDNGYKYILLTIFTISFFVIAIVEITGISTHSLASCNKRKYNSYEQDPDRYGEGYFSNKNGERYRGEIWAEEVRTRSEIVASMQKTTMQFYETKYNFGSVSEGKVMQHTFKFKNTGEHPLMIAKTDVTCGCTTPDFPKEVIPPGGSGDLVVIYNSATHHGFQQKNVVVHSNSIPEAVSISIEADVK